MALTEGIAKTPSSAFAPAKINLALHVTGCRPDGYHEIDTLVMFADVGDVLTADADDILLLEVSGQFSGQVPRGTDNLVLAAAEALRSRTGATFGARLRLTKNLPAGAGIGGGSSDAAAALTLLNRIWKAGLDLPGLMEIGRAIGADVPMCMHAQSLRALGTGDLIRPWPNAPAVPIVIVWPARPVSTASVFAAIASSDNPPIPDRQVATVATLDELVALLACTRNDLTEAACAIEPSIGDVLATLRSRENCLISRMSGSGSACIGIFPNEADAESTASEIAAAYPDWWVKAATAG